MIEHCMAAFEQEIEEKRYRAYVTDALKIIAGNIAGFAGGYTMSQRWVDSFKKPDNRTGDEIAASVMNSAGLRFSEE